MNYEGRKYVLIAGVLFISLVFILRLFWIQVVDGKWKAEAANMAERSVTVYPSRGLIYDRNEQLASPSKGKEQRAKYKEQRVKLN